MAISKITAPILAKSSKIQDLISPKDTGATAAMKELGKNNTTPGSISGQDMADAIKKGTEDSDNQAAGKEFNSIKKFVNENPGKLSPEAKKVYEVYKKEVELAKANKQTGIEPRAYAKMTAAMNQAAKPAAKDVSSADAMKDLLKNNPGPGSISGKEMTDAIVKGTKDKDNQAAGKEFKDIQKFVKENGPKLSPEAKEAYAVYEKAAKAAQAKGQTGIAEGDYNRMVRDMAKAGAPKSQDKSMGDSLKDLAAKNTKPGSISAKELADAVNAGAKDLDGQSAGKEFKDLQKFVKENPQLLSKDAKEAYAMYEKAALAANKKGSTSIGTLAEFNKLTADMAKVGSKPAAPPPVTIDTRKDVDAGAAKSLQELGAANPGPGSISGKELAAAIKAATEDLDGQAAGSEFKQIADFVKQNAGKLSPEAKEAFAVYEKAAKEARAKGETGIPTPIYNKMVKEMEKAGQPKYADKSMGDELNKLAAANTSPGSITGKQLAEALTKGARDLDGSSAGKEFEDLAKFVAENQQLLTPDAKAAFALYEKAAMDARAKGGTSVGSLKEFDALIKKMSEMGASAPTASTGTTGTGGTGSTGGSTGPKIPGPNSTPAEIQAFVDQVLGSLPKPPTAGGSAPATGTGGTTGGGSAPATGSTGGSTPAPSTGGTSRPGGTVQEQAVAMAAGLKEPALPGPNATPQEMLEYEKASKAFDRMFQMLSNAIKNREETLAAINRNV